MWIFLQVTTLRTKKDSERFFRHFLLTCKKNFYAMKMWVNGDNIDGASENMCQWNNFLQPRIEGMHNEWLLIPCEWSWRQVIIEVMMFPWNYVKLLLFKSFFLGDDVSWRPFKVIPWWMLANYHNFSVISAVKTFLVFCYIKKKNSN